MKGHPLAESPRAAVFRSPLAAPALPRIAPLCSAPNRLSSPGLARPRRALPRLASPVGYPGYRFDGSNNTSYYMLIMDREAAAKNSFVPKHGDVAFLSGGERTFPGRQRGGAKICIAFDVYPFYRNYLCDPVAPMLELRVAALVPGHPLDEQHLDMSNPKPEIPRARRGEAGQRTARRGVAGGAGRDAAGQGGAGRADRSAAGAWQGEAKIFGKRTTFHFDFERDEEYYQGRFFGSANVLNPM